MPNSSVVVPSADPIKNFPPLLADAIVALATQAQADLNSLLQSTTPNGKARAVVTSLAAYTAAAGVLTANANGAIGAQDGVTLAVGDQVVVVAGVANVTAADAGPYVVTALGGASAKYVLTRPSWWTHGATLQPAAEVRLGGEGTVFKGTTWRAMCATGKVIGTDDPVLYPDKFRKKITLAAGTYTLGAGGGGELLFLFDATLSSVQLTQNTHAGTLGTQRLEAPSASRTPGVAGTAAIVINSLVDAGTVAGSDTSTVDVLVVNF